VIDDYDHSTIYAPFEFRYPLNWEDLTGFSTPWEENTLEITNLQQDELFM
jgi:hypothetical protein